MVEMSWGWNEISAVEYAYKALSDLASRDLAITPARDILDVMRKVVDGLEHVQEAHPFMGGKLAYESVCRSITYFTAVLRPLSAIVALEEGRHTNDRRVLALELHMCDVHTAFFP